MARARRAKARPARVVVPVVIAVLAVAGVVGAQQGWFTREGASTSSVTPTVMASQRTAAPSESATSTSSSSPDPSDEPSSDGSAGIAEQALAECQASVKAADKTWKAADTGIGHWSEHVQAQTDANAGDISADKMDGIFKRTRLAGPDDVERYEDARSELKKTKAAGSCKVPDGAPASVEAELTDCADRWEAQQPVLEAAEDAMDDWESHLAAMRRSRTGHVHDAQGVWIRAWRAAPKNLKAYDKAEDEFDAPKC